MTAIYLSVVAFLVSVWALSVAYKSNRSLDECQRSLIHHGADMPVERPVERPLEKGEEPEAGPEIPGDILWDELGDWVEQARKEAGWR